MANQSQAAIPAFQPAVMTPQQAAAKALADEMAYIRANGITFGGETRPGGYFIGEDGQPHDAEGETIDEASAEELATEQRRAFADAHKQGIEAMKRREALAAKRAAGGGPVNPMQGTGTEEQVFGVAGDGPSDAAREAGEEEPPASASAKKAARKSSAKK